MVSILQSSITMKVLSFANANMCARLQFVGVWLTVRYRNQKDPRANPSAFLQSNTIAMSSVTSYDPPNRWWVASYVGCGLLIFFFQRCNITGSDIHSLVLIHSVLKTCKLCAVHSMQRFTIAMSITFVLFPLFLSSDFSGPYKFKHFQVIAAFLARHYRNQLDPEEKAARAIFPQHNYLY